MKNKTKTRYINAKTSNGIETLEILQLSDFEDQKAFKKEISNLIKNYAEIGINAYLSQRGCK